jgi:transposase
MSVPGRRVGISAHSGSNLALVEEVPDITLGEMAVHLEETYGLRVSQSSVWRLLDRHGMTFKKNRARQRTATG